MAERIEAPSDVGAELDRLPLTALHVLLMAACALGFMFDLAEIVLGNVLSAIFSAPPTPVDPQTLGWLLAAVYVGAIVGAPVSGWLADRYGRRLVMLLTLAILVVTSLWAGLGEGITSLIVARGISGLALGAYPPLMTAYLADVLPPSRRGPLIMATIAVAYIGPPALVFLVRWLTPSAPLGLESWRWAFLICAVGVIACLALFAFAPESPRWLLSKGRLNEASAALARFRRSLPFTGSSPLALLQRADVAAPLSGRDHLRRIGYLLVIYFLTPWATVGFTLLSGAILVQKGIKVQDSLLYVGVSNFGPIIGTILVAFVIDRLDRPYALAVIAVALAVTGLAFGATDAPIWLMATGLVFSLLTSILLPVLVLYAAELFHPAQRAGATSWAWASNRVGSALVPLALLPLLHSAGPVSMFVVIGLTLAAFAVAVLVFGGQRHPSPATQAVLPR